MGIVALLVLREKCFVVGSVFRGASTEKNVVEVWARLKCGIETIGDLAIEGADLFPEVVVGKVFEGFCSVGFLSDMADGTALLAFDQEWSEVFFKRLLVCRCRLSARREKEQCGGECTDAVHNQRK
ncbi:MAG: hypothetical protein CMO55_27770 [Verrucomicrobiales bacterium]|nr:hypothetical protein [Verrucomicrobiales bacterium]